jgi:hypothetical protein
LFPAERGGYLAIHHFRPFQWRPRQKAVGIDPLRRVYDLRHTFATFALQANQPTRQRCASKGGKRVPGGAAHPPGTTKIGSVDRQRADQRVVSTREAVTIGKS